MGKDEMKTWEKAIFLYKSFTLTKLFYVKSLTLYDAFHLDKFLVMKLFQTGFFWVIQVLIGIVLVFALQKSALKAPFST